MSKNEREKDPDEIPLIVKVQLSQFCSDPDAGRQVLIYDESREYLYEGPAHPDIVKAMNGDEKSYFSAALVPNRDKDGNHLGSYQYALDHKVETQPW